MRRRQRLLPTSARNPPRSVQTEQRGHCHAAAAWTTPVLQPEEQVIEEALSGAAYMRRTDPCDAARGNHGNREDAIVDPSLHASWLTVCFSLYLFDGRSRWSRNVWAAVAAGDSWRSLCHTKPSVRVICMLCIRMLANPSAPSSASRGTSAIPGSQFFAPADQLEPQLLAF